MINHNKKEKINFSLNIFNGNKFPIEIKNKDSLNNLISNYNEIEYIIKQNNPIKFLYFNKTNIEKILYEKEENINIDNITMENCLSDSFYLLLLIDNPNLCIINYEYSLNFIKDINNKLNINNYFVFKKIIKYKIINELILYYEQTDSYEEENQKEELDKIIEDNKKQAQNDINKIKEVKIDINWNIDDINKKRIDELYIEIFEMLLRLHVKRDYKFICNILEGLEFKKIHLTKLMFDKLYNILNNNYYFKKYCSNNLLLNEKAINFYYILKTYILKNSIYIYQFPLLLKLRAKIKQDLLNSYSSIKYSKEEEKYKEIIYFIMDSPYYIKNYQEFKGKKSSNKFSDNSTESTSNSLINGNYIKNCSNNNDDENYYQILKYESTIEKHDKKNESIEFIKEMNNGIIITGGIEDKFSIYDKNFKYIKDINFTIPGDNNDSYRRKFKKYSQNIEETLYSKKNKKSNRITLFDCSKFALMSYSLTISDDVQSPEIKITKPEQISLPCTGIIEIENILNKNEYIAFGEKGIFHFDDWPFSLGINSWPTLNHYNKNKRAYRSGVRINSNYIALSSNKILPNGDNILALYDIKEKKIIKEIKGSFSIRTNALCLFNIEEENKKNKDILLCACKKYNSDGKNGIMAVDIQDKEKDISNKFFDFDNFEVNCFCQIGKSQNFEMDKTNYFFAGGFDINKRLGIIKLLKLIYDRNGINITVIQDIFIEENENLEGFNGTINNIIQTQNGKILVSCWNGKVYSFSEPNISYYLEEDLEEEKN